MTQPDFSAINKLTVLVRERKDALTIRWLGATMTIGIFALIVAWFERGSPRLPMPLTIAFWLVGATCAVLSVWLPRKQLTDPLLARQLARPADAKGWARQLGLGPEQAGTLAELPDLEQRLYGLTILFERPYTLGLALSGGLAVLGLVYGILARTLVEAMPLLLGALALNCWHFPRLTSIIDRGRKLDSIAEDEAAVRSLTGRNRVAPKASPSGRPPSPSTPPPPSVKPPPHPTAGARLRRKR